MNLKLNLDERTVSKYYMDSLISRIVLHRKDVFKVRGWEIEIPAFACKFNPVNQSFAVADEDGIVTLLDSGPTTKPSTRWEAHENAIFDICWASDGRRMLTASGDQTCVMWDVASKKKVRTFQGHTGSVKSVDICKFDQNIFTSGARDGKVILWDTRMNNNNGCVMKISNAHSIGEMIRTTPSAKRNMLKNNKPSVTCVLFQTELAIVSSGSDDGQIKVWDTRRSYAASSNRLPIPSHSVNSCGGNDKKKGFSHLMFDSGKLVLYANCTDNVIYKYNFSTYNNKPLATYTGHQNKSFFIKSALSPDEKYLISGSKDNNAYIWKVDKPGHANWKVDHHSAEVTAVSWNHSDITNFVTCSDDFSVSVWHMSNENTDSSELSGRVEKIINCETPTLLKNRRYEVTPSRSRNALSVEKCIGSSKKEKPCGCIDSNITPKSTRGNSHRLLDGIPSTPFQTLFSEASGDSDVENGGVSTSEKSLSVHKTPKLVLSPSKSENVKHLKSGNVRRNLGLGSDNAKSPAENTYVCNTFSSPTSNLPNYVIDGMTRRTPTPKSQKRQSRVDWLSHLGRQCKRRKIETSTDKFNTISPKRNSAKKSQKNINSIDSYFSKN